MAGEAASFDPTSTLIQGGLGLAESIFGLIKGDDEKEQAEKLAKSRPKRQTSAYAVDELNLAESELANGMSAAVKQQYQEGIDRSLSSSLGAALKYGAGVNMVGDLYDKSIQGQGRLTVIQDNLRTNQIQNLIAANRNMTSEVDKNFQFNEWAPWADKAQANAQARQQSSNMVMSGINTLGSAAMQYGNGVNEANQYNRYFNPSPNYSTDMINTPVQNTVSTINRTNLGFNPAPTYLSNARIPNIQNALPTTSELNAFNNPDTGELMRY